MRSRKARKNHTHSHTNSSIRITVLPHINPLPTARLPNTILKQIDGSGTTGLHENRRNVKRYVHPCRCYNCTLFLRHCITLHLHCTAPFSLHKSILHSLLLSVDNTTIVRAPLSLFTAVCRRHQARQPRSTQHLPVFSKTITFLSFALSILHLTTDTSHNPTLLQAPAAN